MIGHFSKIIFLLVIIFCYNNLHSQLDPNAPWPMFQNNLQHTGQTNINVLGPEKNPVFWPNNQAMYALGSFVDYSQLVIGKSNTVFWPVNSRVRAFTNGYLKWNVPTSSGQLINNSLSVGGDGTIYVGSLGVLDALNPNNGAYKWSCNIGSFTFSAPTVSANNTIYLGCDDSKFYAITNGAIKWTNKLGGAIRSSPALGSNGIIYVGCNDSKLYAISTNGSLIWTNRLGGPIYSSPAIGTDNTIFVGSDDNKLYAITNGAIKWTNRTGNDIKASPAIGNDGTIYIGSLDSKIYAFNPNGTIKWTNRVGNGIYASPTVGMDNTIYIASSDGYITAFTNGVTKWKTNVPGQQFYYSTPVIDNGGILYASTRTSYLYAIIENREPQLIWSSNTGYSNDGVQPNDGYNGQYFRFEVKYIDFENKKPKTNQVWVDLDDNGTYEMDEHFIMFSNSGTSYSNGIIYTNIVRCYYSGDGLINYKFYFKDFYYYQPLPCDPLSDHILTVTNTNITHQLTVTKITNISGTCTRYTNNVVMDVQIWDSKHNHYLTGFQVGNASNMSQGVDVTNVKVWFDKNENKQWDNTDDFVTCLYWDGVSLWTNNNFTFTTNLSFPRNFLVTIDIFSNATVSNAFRTYIPVKGIKCSGITNAPLDALTNYGNVKIGEYLTVTTNRTKNQTCTSFSNNIIMDIRITTPFLFQLTSFKLGNSGTMQQGTEISNIKIWYDQDKNGSFSATADKYITNLIWNGTGLWTNNNIIFTNKIAPYMTIFVTANLKWTITESNTFKAYIPQNGISSSGGKSAPQSALTNNGNVNIGQYMGPIDFNLALGSAAIVLGDVNNDNYLDVMLTGYNRSLGMRRIYKYINNKDNTFTATALAGGVDRPSLALGDIDNDGDLDMICAGEIASLTKYINDGLGGFNLNAIPGAFGVNDPSVALGDIDNDGDLDLIVSGAARLDKYINDGKGNFTNTTKAFGVGVSLSSIALGDIDNDGDLDLIVTGYDGSVSRLDKYINDQSSTNFSGPYPFGAGVRNGSISLGDIDNDGDLDLIVTGEARWDRYFNSDGLGTFIGGAYGVGIRGSSISLGDVDNDGDLDCITMGGQGAAGASRFDKYMNDGTGNLTPFSFGGYAIGDFWRVSIGLGDIDNDGDLDLFAIGDQWGTSGTVFHWYYNVERTPNAKPNVPSNLNATNINSYLRFRWTAPADDKTSPKMLRYKVAYGTNTGKYNYSSTNIDYPRGQANLGNVCVVTGNYYQTKISEWNELYWKVCAIDTSFIPSGYSAESRAYIPRVHNITKVKDYSSIAYSVKDANNGDHLQADRYTFPEQVLISRLTNLLLESTEWASNHFNTNTFIRPITNAGYSVRLFNSKNVNLRGFTIQHATNGVFIDAGEFNKINNNYIISNFANSIKMNNSTANSIFSNILVFNNSGIEINNSTSSTLYRNAIYHQNSFGIELDNSDNNYVINNSLCSNGLISGNGITFINGADNNIVKNNVVAGTKNGYGINLTGGVNNTLTYNDVWDNNPANYNGIAPGQGTITNNPLWLSYDIFSSNFLYLSNMSPCIDKGDPNDYSPPEGNSIVDMGWKEFTRPYLSIELTKSISNVTLNLTNASAIPGATINYRVNCKVNSYGGDTGQNLIIYDKFDNNNITFSTDYTALVGWTVEYATNDNPDQSFGSTEYLSPRPEKEKIKWIRWKIATATGGDKVFYFSAIIK